MCEIYRVKELVKEVLTTQGVTRYGAGFFWGRTQRVARNTELICQLPELEQTTTQIEHFCLMAATYFSETGPAWYLRSKGKNKGEYYETDGEDTLSISADIAEEKLAEIVDNPRVERTRRIIIESGKHSTEMPEAMVLSDARNLDDMGLSGILNEFRRFVLEDKDISDALQAWQGKIDYRYWEARLKSFRFEAVRGMAEHRIMVAEQFVEQLRTETEVASIGEVSADLSAV